ncbi:proton-conducting transporter membrane subunit [Opitutus terrae]|uniref:NADH dehydrogenase (Quinone) n=1 Tax=Opitutus terrae (strain DSM 11246 / JCM 15787 / PB90-1) TaxID=452637 RepID=B1ZSD9_OPITP|nr:proton-conducting transporter membrane subunit [Opitutus terrae]ACB75738.1 NADH dehydrogenase (quinone) [Opitutus terrae PB90-1]
MSIGILLLFAAIAFAGAIAVAWRAPRAWLGFTLLGAAAAFVAGARVLVSGAAWDWRSTWVLGGENLHVRLDAVSAFFLVLLAVVGGAASVYSREYWSDRAHPRSARSGRAWWTLLLATMGAVLVAANGLHFLIAWELFAVSGYFLITRERQRREVRAAGWLYFAASHAGTLCLFGFFTLLAARTGSWDLGAMQDRRELAPLFWLALVGFGVKAGLFPLHIWLPSAHANAPSHVSAILSGVALKMGIYGLVRFSGWLPVPVAAGWVIALLGVASAVLGVAFALGQHDLKRLLAYHSVENIGIILIGLGFALVATANGEPAWGRLALAGGLLHIWNHGLFKALLFLGAGSVLHATGTREMSRLGGLWRTMPWTAGCFTLGAVAISGLPPLNGFVSEWLVFLGLFDAAGAGGLPAWAAVPAAILLGMTGALALACFAKVCGVVFLGLPRSAVAEHAHESGPLMRGPMLLLAACCVAIGLAPVFFWPALAHAIDAWRPAWSGAVALANDAGGARLNPEQAPLAALGACHVALAGLGVVLAWVLWRQVRRNGVTRFMTWDCGYAAPTPRMQYTAGSFAEILTGWFSWILRPQAHVERPVGPFPKRAEHRVHTPETVLEFVIEPVGRVVLAISGAVRRLQHGRLQFYILYLFVGVVAIALLALTGGGG